MMLIALFGCAPSIEYAVPQAEIFMLEEATEGALQFDFHLGSTTKESSCSTIYKLEGEELLCEDCIWDIMFSLERLSDECVYSELEQLRFRVESDRWMVLEDTGWEQWGEAFMIENNVWLLTPLYALLP